MAIPSSGQSLSFSSLRTEFVGGSSAVSLGDLYRGGSNIRKKAANNPATNLAASVATSGTIDTSDYYSSAKGFSFTYATGSITESNLSAQFGDDYAVDYPKSVTIPANTTLGADDIAEYGLEVDSGGDGTITITNNGTIVGCGGAGGSAGSANGGNGSAGGAGGDAVKIASTATIINNGSIFAGGGGGGGAGGGGLGGNLQQQQQSTGQQGPTYDFNPSGGVTYWLKAGGFEIQWPGSGNHPSQSGTVQSGGAPTDSTSLSVGQYTYYRGSFRHQEGSIHLPPTRYYYEVRRTFPQQEQTQTAGHNGGAGGAGGLGRGFNNLPAGDSGASGSAGATGSAGDGGAGGTGGTGADYGASGASGASGATGTSSTTSGSGGGSAGSGGASGLAVEKTEGASLTFTNNGTVQGTVQS